MAKLFNDGTAFDANKVETTYGTLAEGKYDVYIDNAEIADSFDGNGKVLKLRYRILGPKSANACVFDNIDYVNSDDKKANIGRGKLKSICFATGVPIINDTDQLLNKRMSVTTKNTEKDGKVYTNVSKYEVCTANYSATPNLGSAPAQKAPVQSTYAPNAGGPVNIPSRPF